MFFRPIIILIILAVIFGGVYFWLVAPVKTQADLTLRFDWPDETANYFWIKNFVEGKGLAVFEPLNLVAQNQIHPRSFNVRPDGSLVPGSFLGLILYYGFLAKIFGVKLIIYLTPLLAIFGVLAIYGILRRFFGEKVALISAILLLIQPAWWYYSVTSLLPNVPFISLILLSVYFAVKKEKLTIDNLIFAGVFAGLALAIRPAEIVWVSLIYLAIFIYLRKSLSLLKLSIFFSLIFLIILPVFYQQQILYGGFLVSGYSQLQNLNSADCQSCTLVKSLFLPFGFHPALAVYNFWTHFVSRFWVWSLLAILGLIAYLVQSKHQKNEIFSYLMVSLFIFGWIIIYYGSWQFSDLLTIHLNILGLSYVRYFLPLYILALPFVAFGLIWLVSFFKNQFQIFGLIVFIILLGYFSAKLVLVEKVDSLLPVKNRILTYHHLAASVNEITPENSVIVTIRKDKVFFPERKVIHTFDSLSASEEILEILPALAKVAPVYYYALGPEEKLEFDNGFKLEEIKSFGAERLYEIKINNP